MMAKALKTGNVLRWLAVILAAALLAAACGSDAEEAVETDTAAEVAGTTEESEEAMDDDEAMGDEEVIAEAMKALRAMYGDNIPEPDNALMTRWASDEFAFGSYSFLKVGSSAKDRRTLAKPIDDRLFFAGEATSLSYPATTQGAYLSGIPEAERIQARR